MDTEGLPDEYDEKKSGANVWTLAFENEWKSVQHSKIIRKGKASSVLEALQEHRRKISGNDYILNNGYSIPWLGLGTGGLNVDESYNSAQNAVERYEINVKKINKEK